MDNIYIEILWYGSQKMEEGVTYKEVKGHLKEKGFELNHYNEDPIKLWFFTSFYNYLAYFRAERVFRGEDTMGQFNLDFDQSKYYEDKAFLMGHAYMNYLDYIELKEAREASSQALEAARKSLKIAIWAVVISATIALTSIAFQLIISS